MTLWESIQRLVKSRKFWALVASLVAVAGALSTGQISTWEAVQAVVAALSVYSAAIAYVDGNTPPADPAPAVTNTVNVETNGAQPGAPAVTKGPTPNPSLKGRGPE